MEDLPPDQWHFSQVQMRRADEPATLIARNIETGEIRHLGPAQLHRTIGRTTQTQEPTVKASVPLVDELTKLSYETLIKQLYKIPVELPDFLIINNIQSDFILFEQARVMLLQNKIERATFDPLLQPWAGPPTSEYRIITLIGKDGSVYLVKAKYDPSSNQLFP